MNVKENQRFVDLIQKKKEGSVLKEKEIKWMIANYTKGEIPDYQMSAMLMAICFQGMTDDELVAMTLAMKESGSTVDLSRIQGVKVDKHSTGGVGDKTTLVIGPIVAASGIPVAKMSGRGLGFTGGTIDKLESIPGFMTALSKEQFFDIVNRIGLCIAGQSEELAPADKKLYALRDVTATVDSIPLIAASIMSKKLAAGSDKILLDVTTGSGAFIKDKEGAIELAKRMVAIGTKAGKKTVALITNMNTPLGYTIGNNLEVKEAIEALQGRGPKDLMEVCYALAGNMIYLAHEGKVTYEKSIEMARKRVEDGSALLKFKEMVQAQGGDVSFIENKEKFEKAKCSAKIIAKETGYIIRMNTEGIGIASGMLGAGRKTKESPIDFSAGIILKKKTGDYVTKGESIGMLYASKNELILSAMSHLQSQYDIGKDKPKREDLVFHLQTS